VHSALATHTQVFPVLTAAQINRTFDNIVRDFGVRYVEGYTSPNFADVVADAPFSE